MSAKLGLALLALGGVTSCGAQANVTSPPPAQTATVGTASEKPAKPPSRWSARIIAGGDGFKASLFAKNGDVVALTDRDVWIVHPTQPPRATLVDLKDTPMSAAVAENAERAVVLTRGGQLAVLRLDGSIERTIDAVARDKRSELSLSADGRVASLETVDASDVWARLYDLDTGKALGAAKGMRARLHEKGAYVITSHGVYSPDGAPVVESSDSAEEGVWIGDRAVYFLGDELRLVDAPKKATVRLTAACPAREGGYSYVDRLTKRAVRLCRDRAIVFNVDKLARSEIKLTVPKWLDSPMAPSWQGLAFGHAGEIVSYWIADERSYALVIDPVARTAKATKLSELPPLRAENGAILLLPQLDCTLGSGPASSELCRVPVSPDGALATWTRGRALVIQDLKTGAPRARFGIEPPRSGETMELRERDGGLDVLLAPRLTKRAPAADSGELRIGYRFGPQTDSDQAVVKLGPRPEGCAPMKGIHLKKLGDRTLAYDFGFRSPCLCEADGTCIQMKLPDRVSPSDIGPRFGIGVRFGGKPAKGTDVVLFNLDGTVASSRTLDGKTCPVWSLDERRGAAAAVCGAPDAANEIVELSLPALEDRRRTPLDGSTTKRPTAVKPSAIPRETRVAWAGSMLLVEQSDSDLIDAALYRADDAKPLGRLVAFHDFGLVTFADGKVERFGALGGDADGALVCTDGKEVAPYAVCRAEVEVTGRFSVR